MIIRATARRMLPASAALGLLLAAAAASSGCRKTETTGGARASASPSPTVPADLSPHLSEKPGSSAPSFAGLRFPRGIAVDGRGRVWVADFGNAAVRLFDAAGGLFGGWGGHGEGTWAMKDPCGIAVRGNSVYVADTWRSGVERFTDAGQFQAKLAADLYGAHGIAAAANGIVYVADTGNNRIIVCNADLTGPKAIGKSGAGPEQFASPVAVAVGPSGDVYVTDTGNRRIQVLDASGKFKTSWKFAGWGANAEAYVDTDADGSLFVSDPVAGAVVMLDRKGVERRRWTADGEGKKFARPTGVAVDRKNRILFVANTDSGAISRVPLDGK
ncbi:MAG: NHL repeat-containing protein [Thermoanaerobaculia bacterium]